MSGSLVRINLADVIIAFSSDKKINEARKQKRFKRVVTDRRPDVIIEDVYSLPRGAGVTNTDLVFDAPHWSYHNKNGYKIFVSKASIPGPKVTALFNRGMSRGKIYLPVPGYDWLKSSLGVVIIENLLSLRKRFMFHGCGIAERGKGYLFLGESGAGKTTMSGLWRKQGGSIIHDDQVVVYKRGSRFIMTGLGIRGRAKPPYYRPEKKVGLHNIFFLRHGEKNILERICPLDIFKTLVKKTPSFVCDKNGLEEMFSFYLDFTRAVPGHNLTFTPNAACVDYIRERR